MGPWALIKNINNVLIKLGNVVQIPMHNMNKSMFRLKLQELKIILTPEATNVFSSIHMLKHVLM